MSTHLRSIILRALWGEEHFIGNSCGRS